MCNVKLKIIIMATRSRIAIKNKNGKIKSIYCHWDGYPEYVGKLLLSHYNNVQIIRKLIKLGDVSSLRETIKKVKGHSFETPDDNCTIFYGRDRGDKNVSAIEHKTEIDFIKKCYGTSAEFVYLFDVSSNQWYYYELSYSDDVFESIINNNLKVVWKELTLDVVNADND